MSYFDETIAYLEDEDFTPDGKLKLKPGKPVVIMIQGDFCGYCKQMKPAFQGMAKKTRGKVMCATIQTDGDESEKKLAKRISAILPKDSKGVSIYKGVPMVVAFKGGNFAKEYKGDRGEQSLVEFAKTA